MCPDMSVARSLRVKKVQESLGSHSIAWKLHQRISFPKGLPCGFPDLVARRVRIAEGSGFGHMRGDSATGVDISATAQTLPDATLDLSFGLERDWGRVGPWFLSGHNAPPSGSAAVALDSFPGIPRLQTSHHNGHMLLGLSSR